MGTIKMIFILLLTLATLASVCQSQPDFVVTLPVNDVPIIDTVVLNSAGEDRIVGGTEAIKNEFPGIVNLVIAKTSGSVFCGGNIIDSNWIFTAAHCVWPLDQVLSISVRAGDHYINQIDGTEQTRNGRTMYVPGSYNTVTKAYDIALIELATPFNMNEYVQQTTVANPNYVSTGDAIVAGWGRNSNTGSTTNELRKANVSFVSNSICERNFGVPIFSTMVCASAPNRGVCNGDSGGPMMVRSQTANGLFLAGIADFVDAGGCGNDRVPDVFQRVSSHVGWIQSHVDNVKIDPGLPPTTTTERTTTLRTTTMPTDKPTGGNGVERTSTNFIAQFILSSVLLYQIVVTQC